MYRWGIKGLRVQDDWRILTIVTWIDSVNRLEVRAVEIAIDAYCVHPPTTPRNAIIVECISRLRESEGYIGCLVLCRR